MLGAVYQHLRWWYLDELSEFIQHMTPQTSVNLTRIISSWRIAYHVQISDAIEVLILEGISRSENGTYLVSICCARS